MIRPLLFGLLASVAHTQYVVQSASFGYGSSLSPNNKGIPEWHISGEGHTPQLLSDKVILTPPSPGNRRGALWTENRLSKAEWIADFEFRATGPERGGGNLQLWYTKEGQVDIGTSSLYTVGKFDGMVLVVDTFGGRGGSIRGFLNDGSTDFKSHHNVDSLSFGHCDYAYRNLGRPSHIQIKQESNSFQVFVDQRLCFKSEQIKLPMDYYFGVSAASAETPDTFEVFKFIVTTSSAVTREEPLKDRVAPPAAQKEQQASMQQMPDAPGSSPPQISDAKLADLQDRLQLMSHSVDNLFREFSKFAAKADERHSEMLQKTFSSDQLGALDRRLQAMENKVDGIKQDVGSKDYQPHFDALHNTLKSSHKNLLEGLPQSVGHIVSTRSPRMGTFIFIIVAVQFLIAGSYVVYKRRKANGPKKYL